MLFIRPQKLYVKLSVYAFKLEKIFIIYYIFERKVYAELLSSVSLYHEEHYYF